MGLPPGTYRILRGHPHLSGLTASHLPPRRGKALRAADSRSYSGKRARSVGSAKPGAVHKPQQRQFLQTQGPVARNETIKVTQILRAGNPATWADSPCQGEMSRSDRGGRVGEYERVSAHLSRPRRSFGDFPIAGKVTRPAGRNPAPPPGRRNLSAYNKPNPKSAPSSVTASPCHLPPRGKAKMG